MIGGPLIANHTRHYQGEELQTALKDLGADIYVVESQVELTLARVVPALRDSGDLRRVPNIHYRGGGGIFLSTGAEPENNCLDENYIDWLALSREDLGATLQQGGVRKPAETVGAWNLA